MTTSRNSKSIINSLSASILSESSGEDKLQSQSPPIETRYLPEISKENQAILKALAWVEKPFDFSIENLDEDILDKLAKKTNSALIHCTGNCALLACVLLYNLGVGRAELSVKNVFPIYRPPNLYKFYKIILNHLYILSSGEQTTSFAELTRKIFARYKETSDRTFIIAIDRKPHGHLFNAVVLGNNESLRIVFVDAWKTKKSIYRVEEMEKRYSGKFALHLYEHFGKILSLIPPITNNYQHKLSIFNQKPAPITPNACFPRKVIHI